MNKHGKIKVTKSGRLVSEGKVDEDLLIKLLLKVQFPSPSIRKKNKDGNYVFPMEVVLNIFKHFETLNKFELGYLFMCNHMDRLSDTIEAINKFRSKYERLENKLNLREVVNIFTKIMQEHFPNIKNKPETYFKDYSDALIRTLEYTGLFSQRGRGYYLKLYIPEHAKLKMKLLQEQFVFTKNVEDDFEKYMEWFGNPHNLLLPWEDKDNLRTIIDNKATILKAKLKEAKQNLVDFTSDEKIEKLIQFEDYQLNREKSQLIDLDKELSEKIVTLNEELFIKYHSKTEKVRNEILEKFADILDGNEDLAALWLECNTWKSLVAINGHHYVKRNFKIEEDLSPKAFAPGLGNTPDMELYTNDYILIPEVSLMTGIRQWEHEGSSVIDHVYKFIEQYTEKQVLGLFISSKMNVRVIWQFFVLNRESWIGKAVPVIPLTIKQYVKILTSIYENQLKIDDFKNIIEIIHKNTFICSDFKQWERNIERLITNWCLN